MHNIYACTILVYYTSIRVTQVNRIFSLVGLQGLATYGEIADEAHRSLLTGGDGSKDLSAGGCGLLYERPHFKEHFGLGGGENIKPNDASTK